MFAVINAYEEEEEEESLRIRRRVVPVYFVAQRKFRTRSRTWPGKGRRWSCSAFACARHGPARLLGGCDSGENICRFLFLSLARFSNKISCNIRVMTVLLVTGDQ